MDATLMARMKELEREYLLRATPSQTMSLLVGISALLLHWRLKSITASRVSWGTQPPFRAPQLLFLTGYVPPATPVSLHVPGAISPQAHECASLQPAVCFFLHGQMLRPLFQRTVFVNRKKYADLQGLAYQGDASLSYSP
jgi:hypothetical protein